MIILDVDKVINEVRQTEPMTSGSSNTYVVKFNFSNEWQYLTRTAVFRAGNTTISILLDDTNRCMVPWEVLKNASDEVLAGCYGVAEDNVVLPTVWTSLGTILQGVIEGSKPSEPSSDLWTQMSARLQRIEAQLADIITNGTGTGGGGGGINYTIGHGLKEENKTLSVNSVDDYSSDNTLPAQATLVKKEIGGVNTLLEGI